MQNFTTPKIQKTEANIASANKDKNLKSFEVIYGEVVDKSKRNAFANFSRATHFNAATSCKYHWHLNSS